MDESFVILYSTAFFLSLSKKNEKENGKSCPPPFPPTFETALHVSIRNIYLPLTIYITLLLINSQTKRILLLIVIYTREGNFFKRNVRKRRGKSGINKELVSLIPSKTSLDRAYIYIPFDDFKFILYSDRRRESVHEQEGGRGISWEEERNVERAASFRE